MASELSWNNLWFDLAQSDKDELLTKTINNTDTFSSTEASKII